MFSKLCLPSNVLGLMGLGRRSREGDGRCRGQGRESCSGDLGEHLEVVPMEGLKDSTAATVGSGLRILPSFQHPPILGSHTSAGWGFRIQNLVSPQNQVGWVGSQPGSQRPILHLVRQRGIVGPGPRPYHNYTPYPSKPPRRAQGFRM